MLYTKEKVEEVVSNYVKEHSIITKEEGGYHLTDSRLAQMLEELTNDIYIECIHNTYEDYMGTEVGYYESRIDSIIYFYSLEPEIEFEDIEDVVEMFMNIQDKLEDVKKHIK